MSRRASASKVVLALWAAAALLAVGLAVVLSLPEPRRGAAPPPATAPRCTPENPCLAVVIDDVGRDLSMLKRFLAIKGDITYAVLPHAPHTGESVKALKRHRREYLVHLPMAPLDVSKVTREAVVVGLDGPVEPTVAECLARVPGAVGVNNHMGSALSKDPREMARVLSIVKKNGMWFLDSKTTKGSIICEVAKKLGVACRQRDVFLDDPPSQAAVQLMLEGAISTARKRGWAIAIGHPKEATYKVVGRFFQNPQINVVGLTTLFSGTDAT